MFFKEIKYCTTLGTFKYYHFTYFIPLRKSLTANKIATFLKTYKL